MSFLIIIYYGFCRRLVTCICGVVKIYIYHRVTVESDIEKKADRIYGLFSYKPQYSIQNQGCFITSRGNNFLCVNIYFTMKLVVSQAEWILLCVYRTG